MKKTLFIYSLFLLFLSVACNSPKTQPVDFIQDNVENAVLQHTLQIKIFEETGEVYNPRTTHKDGSVQYIPMEDWTSGFFPGSLWYTYKLTEDVKWRKVAEAYTESLDSVKYLKWHHDVGFMIGCSFLNGLRETGNPAYKNVIVEAARSLSTRYRPGAGVIQSWDTDKGWMAERGWTCPVIIDNMMNLELLFEASLISGDTSFYEIAVRHADVTLEHHYRDDNSSYHVIDYDPVTGKVLHKHTAQGYAHESAWARGQAWGLYGYITCYRYTKDVRYLKQAQKIYTFIFNHENMPEDLVPYWDFNAPDIPKAPRDASAAACTASALYELSTYLPDKGYKEKADQIMESLASSRYRAKVGTNGNFILKHSVGSIPHDQEIDVPLNYADYYFLEGLIRKKELE